MYPTQAEIKLTQVKEEPTQVGGGDVAGIQTLDSQVTTDAPYHSGKDLNKVTESMKPGPS